MKTWLLTGASRGLGAVWTHAILARGDSLAAAARDTTSLEPLAEQYGDRFLPLKLDVSDADAVRAAVQTVESTFGGIDVLVNNAGHMLTAAVEEATDDQIRAQMEVNYLGALWTTRAVLPGMRARRQGRILQVSSLGGLLAYPALGIYQASKWALEAVSESLAAEVAAYGIHVTLIEPVMFPTTLMTRSPKATTDPAYEHAHHALYAGAAGFSPGNPATTADALFALVDAPEPPIRALFGTGGLEAVRTEYAGRLASLEDWDHVARLAQGHTSDDQ
ncbi:SDR family NAD(P)-dependent oxidoreductase [Lentzea sp. NPDC058450]|uniref:SDR family NAD(P)-dependent oxidoreductase n=1 Tax=Lentzea sp. NPDC058450 TaxID=3346505 RepID=UPI00364827A6